MDTASAVITDITYTTISFVNAGDNVTDARPFSLTDSAFAVQVAPKGLIDNKVYYYSVFVKATSNGKWYRAGNTMGLSVKDYGTAALMYEYLPIAYKVSDLNTSLVPNSTSNPDLYNFLKIFAFEYDFFKAMAENVKNRYDIENLNGRLIPLMMNEFGYRFESEMGLAQARRLLKNTAEINLTKGTLRGLKKFVKEFSGYDAVIPAPTNLFLSNDAASFETSVDSWISTSNGTLTAVSGASESPVVVPYAESTSPSNFPNSQLGLLKVSANSAAAVTFKCGSTAPVTSGIPVTASTAYSFTVYSRAKTTLCSISLNIDWYTSAGVYISSGTAASSNNSTSAWTRHTKVTATSPSTAAFAVPVITINSPASGEIHYFDAAQFQLGSSATNYVDARRIDIYLKPGRVNLMYNPSFETNATTGWQANANSTLAVSTAAAKVGTHSALITFNYTGGSTVLAGLATTSSTSYMAPVSYLGSPLIYMFSMYLKDVNTNKQYVPYVDFYTSAGTLMAGELITGDSFSISSSSWTQVYLPFFAPEGAAYARPYIYAQGVTSADNGKQVYYDAASIELVPNNGVLLPYFDGSTGYYNTDDLLWAGSSIGQSMYYKNRVNVYPRLKTILPEYLPYGSSWALFIGTLV